MSMGGRQTAFTLLLTSKYCPQVFKTIFMATVMLVCPTVFETLKTMYKNGYYYLKVKAILSFNTLTVLEEVLKHFI